MFRFFKYIVIFIAGYKLVKMVMAQLQPQERVEPTPTRQNINHNNQYQQPTSNPSPSKFNDAELIDYEEIK